MGRNDEVVKYVDGRLTHNMAGTVIPASRARASRDLGSAFERNQIFEQNIVEMDEKGHTVSVQRLTREKIAHLNRVGKEKGGKFTSWQDIGAEAVTGAGAQIAEMSPPPVFVHAYDENEAEQKPSIKQEKRETAPSLAKTGAGSEAAGYMSGKRTKVRFSTPLGAMTLVYDYIRVHNDILCLQQHAADGQCQESPSSVEPMTVEIEGCQMICHFVAQVPVTPDNTVSITLFRIDVELSECFYD